MRLSLQQKEQFFHELHESVRSGISLVQTLKRKAEGRFGSQKAIAAAMLERAGEATAVEYFASLPEVFPVLDREIIAGGEVSGRLDASLAYLRDYYDALARARRRIFSRLLYPLCLLHVGALLLSVPAAVEGGVWAFLREALGMLLFFYGVLFLAWLAAWLAARAAGSSADADRWLQTLPAVGGARVALIGSRFCKSMGMLVGSGVGIVSSLGRSASASGSALFRRGAAEACATIRAGSGLWDAVAQTRAFPQGIDHAFQIGEQSGRLDEEMERQAGKFTEILFGRLEALSFWLPQIIYVMIVCALAWRIFSFWSGWYGQINSLLG